MAKVAVATKRVEVTTITPEMAAKILANNPKNRALSKNAVAAMVRDMELGRWNLNGASVCIGENDELYDGQHRLTACVTANIPFETVMVTGLVPDDRLTIDRMRPRNIGDILTIAHDVHSGKLVASVIRAMSIYANQDLGVSPTAAEYVEILDAHPGLIESANLAIGSPPARPSILAAIHYIGGTVQRHRDRADSFVNVFKSGIPDYDGDAAHVLREMLIRERQRGFNRADFKTYSLFANAWEKFLIRTPVKNARSKNDFRLEGWDESSLVNSPLA